MKFEVKGTSTLLPSLALMAAIDSPLPGHFIGLHNGPTRFTGQTRSNIFLVVSVNIIRNANGLKLFNIDCSLVGLSKYHSL